MDPHGAAASGAITIWPEWLEQDLLAEKWDAQGILTQAGKGSKDPKSKAFFEDPDGRTRLPRSLMQMFREWKRPQELFGDNISVARSINRVNLKDPNSHLLHSEFIRHFISYVMFLWYLVQRRKLSQKQNPGSILQQVTPTAVAPPPPEPVKSSNNPHKESKLNISAKDTTASKVSQGELPPRPACFEDPMADWAPWNLIFGGPALVLKSSGKNEPFAVNRATNLPQYNPNGKYAVRLYWMGCWRKILVDDMVPVDENGRSLLPTSNERNEIWPIILSKAVLKVISMDYGGGFPTSEIGDPTFILHTLTGWVPHAIYLTHPKSTRKHIWNKLQAVLLTTKNLFMIDSARVQLREQEDAKDAWFLGWNLRAGLVTLNRRAPPDDILSAAAVNWDVRSYSALRRWKVENHPGNLQKIDTMRNERSTSAYNTLSSTPVISVTAGSQSNSSTLTLKANARGASAVPRKVENLSPSTLTVPQSAARNVDAVKTPKISKSPEILLLATYRSAHHDADAFDNRAQSRSEKLYSAGFLRTESHPLLLRHLRHIKQQQKSVSATRFKIARPLSRTIQPYKRKSSLFKSKKRQSIRCIEFLSLFWKKKGRLIHQTSRRAKKLLADNPVTAEEKIKFRPMDGYENDLPAIPEEEVYPRVRKRPSPPKQPEPPIVVPPPTPVHEEKKGKGGESKTGNVSAPEPPPPLPPLPAPPQNAEELQQIARLNFASIEFNQFYETLETLYVICKPETFAHHSIFSYYHPSVVTDGRLPTAKKKGVEPVTQQSVSSVEGGSRGTPNKPNSAVNQGKFGKIAAELPSAYLILDNPYPTNVVVTLSALYRWAYSNRVQDPKSQERLSLVAGMEELKAEKPCSVVISVKRHNWLDFTVTPTLFTMKTSSIHSAVYHVPAGRHIWRLKVTCPGRKESEPLGYSIRVMSKDPVQIGPEEQILKASTFDSYQFSIMARKIFIPVLKWWKSNGTPAFTHPPHRELIRLLGFEEDAKDKQGRNTFLVALLRGIYNSVQLYLRDFCNPKGSMALRAFFGDITTTNILNLGSTHLVRRESKAMAPAALPPPKPDSHGSRPTETMKRSKQKNPESSAREKSAPQTSAPQPDKESVAIKSAMPKKAQMELLMKLKSIPASQKAVSLWEMYFFSLRARSVRESRKAGSKKKESVMKIAQEMLEAILKNEQNFASCFLRNLCRNLPVSWIDVDFFVNQEARYIWKDFSGTFTDIPSNSWRLIFRDIFHVNEPLLISFRLTIPLAPCRLFVVNNDTGQLTPSILFQPLPHLYAHNENGYTVVAEARAGLTGWKGGSLSLRVVQQLDPLKHESTQAENLLIKFGNAVPQSIFTTREVNDYFLPEVSSFAIASVVVKTKVMSLVTVCFTTSSPDVLVELIILRNREQVCYRTCGRGLTTVPAFLFLNDPGRHDFFIVRVNCLGNSWPLSGEEWKFAFNEKLRRSSVEYGRETPLPTPAISPAKSVREPSSKKGKTKQEKEKERTEEKQELKDTLDSSRSTKTKDKDKQALDTSHPYWTMKFVLETNDSEFEVRLDAEKDDALRAELQAALSVDSNILQRGKDFREDYLKKAGMTGFYSPDSAEYAGWSQSAATSEWPRPSRSLPQTFDTIARRKDGETLEELDLFLYQKELRTLQERYNVAVSARASTISAEKKAREEEIINQCGFLKELMENTIVGRQKYVEQRDVYKKMLDDEEGREGLAAAAAVPKKVEKKKPEKKKK